MPSAPTSFLAALAVAFATVQATTLTLNDYAKFSDGSADNNPPTCGIPYSSLNLAKVTAWSSITGEQDPKCGSCAKVCGSSGCEFLLVIDQCTLKGDHLDISTLAGPGVVGSDTGNHEVSMELVDVSNCAGIWDGRMFFDYQVPNANFKALQGLTSGNSPKAAQTSTAVAAVFAPVESSTQVVEAAAAYASTSSPAPAPATSSVESHPVYSSPAAEPSQEPSTQPAEEAVTPTPAPYVQPSSSSSREAPAATPSPYAESSSSPIDSIVSEETSKATSLSTPSVTIVASATATATGPAGYASPSGFVSVTASGNGTAPSATATPPVFLGAGAKLVSASSSMAACFFAALAVLLL